MEVRITCLRKLALHETMEFHEVINFMTTSLLKSKLSQGVVFDDDLRALLDKNVKLSTLHSLLWSSSTRNQN